MMLAPILVLPMLSSMTHLPGGNLMNGESEYEGNNLGELAHLLADAYANALMHDTLGAALKKKDLRLESASIEFSSALLYEITEGSCQSPRRPTTSSPDRTCVLDDESFGLRSLTDMLSNAAYRLESLGNSVSAQDAKNNQLALVTARIGSLEHLYRTVFAISRIYLDKSQKSAYVDAASEELKLAREHIELERSLCACSDRGYTERLQELSQLDERLKDLRA